MTGLVLAGLLVAFWLPARAIEHREHYDEFNDSSFSGSDGPVSWASDWIEIGESDGADEGAIQVNNDGKVCISGDCLVLGHKPNSNGKGAYRKVDLDGATSVIISFGYRRHLHGDESGRVEFSFSGNGGSSWTLLGATHSTPKTVPSGG